jgi:hypothetical protein
VAIEQSLRDAPDFGIQGCGVEGHAGHRLEHNRMIRCLFRIASPRERRMAGNQNRGNGHWIERAEALHNFPAGVQNVIAADLIGA